MFVRLYLLVGFAQGRRQFLQPSPCLLLRGHDTLGAEIRATHKLFTPDLIEDGEVRCFSVNVCALLLVCDCVYVCVFEIVRLCV